MAGASRSSTVVTAVVDQVYEAASGSTVKIGADGKASPLSEGTLIPVGQSDDHLLVVDSDQGLYALLKQGAA